MSPDPDDFANAGMPPGTPVLYRPADASPHDPPRSATVVRVFEDGRYLIQLDPRDPSRDDYLDAVLEVSDPETRAWLLAQRDQGDAALAEDRRAGLRDQDPFPVDAATLTRIVDG